MSENKIATIERLLSVVPHPNADRLDLVTVLGYQCVTERGLHKAGDLIIYIQPDSVLPEDAEWAETYRKYSPTRIKAVKLRGEFSEGIIVKLDQVKDYLLENLILVDEFLQQQTAITGAAEGADVSIALNITHYEPPLPQDLSAKGLLPFGIPKTDETRWENKISSLPFGEIVDVTLKIDGQSWSAYYNLEKDEFGVMGRTMEYKEDTVNNYTAHIDRYDIRNKLIAYCKKHGVSLCIRGESYGAGIQSFDQNPHGKGEKGLALFSVYNIGTREYERKGSPHYCPVFCKATNIPAVSAIESDVVLTRELIDKYSKELKKLNGAPFEGVVINHGPYEVLHDVVLEGDEYPGGRIEFTDVKHFNAGSFKVINKIYDSGK
jgi:RNA ligase (TIGR02306 family)